MDLDEKGLNGGWSLASRLPCAEVLAIFIGSITKTGLP
jgi:hypothetical protein